MEAPQRRSQRYPDSFEDIWRLQAFLLDEADQAETPIVVNKDKEQAMQEIMKIVITRLTESHSASPREVFGNVHSSYRESCKKAGGPSVYKGLMIILDGLGDRPNPALNNRTPLQAAYTPVMDALVAAGSCGLVDPLRAGFPVDTHTGCAALMGVTRRDQLSMARGPIEAAGVGVEMMPGDILLRANFATLQDDGCTIIDRRAGRIIAGYRGAGTGSAGCESGCRHQRFCISRNPSPGRRSFAR